MADTAVKIKISTDVEISALKALEAQLQKQTVQAKALGKPFQEFEQQLGQVQGRLLASAAWFNAAYLPWRSPSRGEDGHNGMNRS